MATLQDAQSAAIAVDGLYRNSGTAGNTPGAATTAGASSGLTSGARKRSFSASEPLEVDTRRQRTPLSLHTGPTSKGIRQPDGKFRFPLAGTVMSSDVPHSFSLAMAVTAWPAPTTVKEIQQFLGLTNFFRKFILGYCNLAAPMTELTKKNVDWLWSNDCDKAFQELKSKLSTAPVLAIPDPAAPFELISDSCGFGIGAVLMQNNRPVAFYSRKMTDPERSYANHEQELLAAIVALKVFRCYLLGNHLTLITDNKPNTYLDSQPTLSRRQAR